MTDESFATDVLTSEKPVLVDFWAEWCGPCRKVGPILEEIYAEHGDKIDIVKLNVDENPRTAQDYRVISIPTMNVYQGGQVVKTIVGAWPKPRLLVRARRLHQPDRSPVHRAHESNATRGVSVRTMLLLRTMTRTPRCFVPPP